MAQIQSAFGTLALAATTGLAGYTLVNGTGNIWQWTAPNDGKLHRYMIFADQVVTSTETGGEIAVAFTPPGTTQQTEQFSAAGLAAGVYGPNSFAFLTGVMQPGTTITLSQFTALTAGASGLWAELWAT